MFAGINTIAIQLNMSASDRIGIVLGVIKAIDIHITCSMACRASPWILILLGKWVWQAINKIIWLCNSVWMKPSIVYSSPFRLLGISYPERSTNVANLSLGTAHVEGSNVMMLRLSMESLEVIFTALCLLFPAFRDFKFFRTGIDDAESESSISGETERDPKAQIQ